MKQQALRADFLMLLAAMIWGASFVAQQVGRLSGGIGGWRADSLPVVR